MPYSYIRSVYLHYSLNSKALARAYVHQPRTVNVAAHVDVGSGIVAANVKQTVALLFETNAEARWEVDEQI